MSNMCSKVFSDCWVTSDLEAVSKRGALCKGAKVKRLEINKYLRLNLFISENANGNFDMVIYINKSRF